MVGYIFQKNVLICCILLMAILTLPTMGAFGMTYEQGGSGRAGFGIVKRDGDTLTLKQRIDHHFSTSLLA
jgi:hypothetical protein